MRNVVHTSQYNHPTQPQFLSERVERYYRERVEQTWRGKHLLKGRTPGENAIILSSNDYLSIANHPDIVSAQIETLLLEGNGAAMSAVFFNEDNPQSSFEKKFALFLGAEEVVLSQSGWCANVGLLQAIATKNTPVYLDMCSHMSLWEGVQSAGARAIPFAHNNVNILERMLKKHGPGVIAVDSIYSTTGDLCPLVSVVDLAVQYDSIIIVDESHSLGTHGSQGAGLVAEYNLGDKVHFITASLAKAFAGRGGIIAGSTRNMEYLRYEARPAIFSSAVLPHDVAGFDATLKVIIQEEWRRKKVQKNANYLRSQLLDIGYNVSQSKSQIISLIAGPESNTMILRDALEAEDIFGAVFCAPATAKEGSMIRFSITAQLNMDQLNFISSVCKKIKYKVKMQEWPSTLMLRRLESA